MSLNCLACSQVVKTDSPIECAPESPSLRKSRSMAVDRGSWSGNNINVTPPHERHGTRGPMAKIKREHRRTQSAADAFHQGEPRLIRSPGMRRDWSFENLADKK